MLEHKHKILCEVSNETFGPVVDILNNFKFKLYDATKLPEMVELTGKQITDNILALP